MSMKTKIPIFIICLTLLIAGVNLWLSYSPSPSMEPIQGSMPASSGKITSDNSAELDVVLSDDAEYPAPVKQLQQALAQGLRDDELSQETSESNADYSPRVESGESSEKLDELKDRLARLKQLVDEN